MQWFKRKTRISVTPTQSIIPTEYQPPPTLVRFPVPTDEKIIRKRNCCQRCCTKKTLKEQALLIATVVSVILGVVVGIALRELKCKTGRMIKGRF